MPSRGSVLVAATNGDGDRARIPIARRRLSRSSTGHGRRPRWGCSPDISRPRRDDLMNDRNGVVPHCAARLVYWSAPTRSIESNNRLVKSRSSIGASRFDRGREQTKISTQSAPERLRDSATMATGRVTNQQSQSTSLDHNADLWAHIQPESSRLLLLSALDAFLARGYHGATTREIGVRAGMSPAAVYVHWKAKHDLLFEISRIGHRAVLKVVEQALARTSPDPVERVHVFVSTFAAWHARNHALARVIQYEFKRLPPAQLSEIVEIRDRFETLMRDELARGVDAGVFDVTDIQGTALAVLSLCIDLARWYSPSRGHSSAEAIGELYAELALRMLRRQD